MRGDSIDVRETSTGRFASTVAHYESARAPYGKAFFAAVGRDLGLDRSQRLLDVGTGPDLLAIGFAPDCREVVGVDPEPAMVEAARSAAVRAGVAVKFVKGRFEDKAAGLGGFDVVTIGRAIHWLDPEPAQKALDRVVSRAAGFSSATPRASTTAATPGFKPSCRCATAGGPSDRPLIATVFSPADRSSRAGRSGSRRPPR